MDTETSRGNKSFGIVHKRLMFVLIVDKVADRIIFVNSIVSISIRDNTFLTEKVSRHLKLRHIKKKSRSTYNHLITLF